MLLFQVGGEFMRFILLQIIDFIGIRMATTYLHDIQSYHLLDLGSMRPEASEAQYLYEIEDNI